MEKPRIKRAYAKWWRGAVSRHASTVWAIGKVDPEQVYHDYSAGTEFGRRAFAFATEKDLGVALSQPQFDLKQCEEPIA